MKILPRTVYGQPTEDCEILRWIGETVDNARSTRQFFEGGFTDDGINTRQLAASLWGIAFRRTERVGGEIDTQAFRYQLLKATFDWCREHLETGSVGDEWIGVHRRASGG